MMGRTNSSLKRSLYNGLGAALLVAMPAFVSSVASVAFAAPDDPAPAAPAAAADAKTEAKGEGSDGAKASPEKATSKKPRDKAAKRDKKKTASKGSAGEKQERSGGSKAKKSAKKGRKKAQGAGSASKPAADARASTDRSGILLSKPVMNAVDEPVHESKHEGETKQASTKHEGASAKHEGETKHASSKHEGETKHASSKHEGASKHEGEMRHASTKHEGASTKGHATSKHAEHAATMKASTSSSSKESAHAATVKASTGASSKETMHASNVTKKGSKKASSRSKAARRRAKKGESGDKEASHQPCFGPAVTVDRAGLEPENFPLVTCKGEPLAEARDRLSLLARPWGMIRPDQPGVVWNAGAGAGRDRDDDHGDKSRSRRAKSEREREVDPIEVAPGVRRVDEGLVARLSAVTRKFPGKVVSLVSGYRPQSRGSMHQSARALDLRVAGVANEDLVAFCKTLTDTGCGYYPNSSFVHMDVRLPGTGSVSWIDASGPGEAPRYVMRWPEPASDTPPFSPPTRGDATEMGHDLGASGSPSAALSAGKDDDDANEKGEGNSAPAPLLEDPPN